MKDNARTQPHQTVVYGSSIDKENIGMPTLTKKGLALGCLIVMILTIMAIVIYRENSRRPVAKSSGEAAVLTTPENRDRVELSDGERQLWEQKLQSAFESPEGLDAVLKDLSEDEIVVLLHDGFFMVDWGEIVAYLLKQKRADIDAERILWEFVNDTEYRRDNVSSDIDFLECKMFGFLAIAYIATGDVLQTLRKCTSMEFTESFFGRKHLARLTQYEAFTRLRLSCALIWAPICQGLVARGIPADVEVLMAKYTEAKRKVCSRGGSVQMLFEATNMEDALLYQEYNVCVLIPKTIKYIDKYGIDFLMQEYRSGRFYDTFGPIELELPCESTQ